MIPRGSNDALILRIRSMPTGGAVASNSSRFIWPIPCSADIEPITSGEFHPFTGPVKKQDGSEWLKDGEKAEDGVLLGLNFYVAGVDDKLPQ